MPLLLARLNVLLLVFFLVLGSTLVAVGQEESLYMIHRCKEASPGFATVRVIDRRLESQTLGFVQSGLFNRFSLVKFDGNLADSIGRFFVATDSVAATPMEFTAILYEFYISERTEGMSEQGRFRLSMRFFASEGKDHFKEIATIDSAYTCEAIDVTKKLLRSVSEHLCEIAGNSLAASKEIKSGPIYSYMDLLVLDSIEKSHIPIYAAAKVNAGIYFDYEHFKQNMPDTTFITVSESGAGNIKVYGWDANRKKKHKIDNMTVYAVSDGTKVYKATQIGFYELKKEKNDFYYVGQTSFSNSNHVAAVGYAFGLVGAAIAVAAASERGAQRYRFRINYLKGNSVPLSKAL